MNTIATQNFQKQLSDVSDFVIGFESNSTMTDYYLANHKVVLGGLVFSVLNDSDTGAITVKYLYYFHDHFFLIGCCCCRFII